MRVESLEISKLREQAKKLGKATGEKHTKCLYEIAKANGYKTWERLIEAKAKENA